jgi:hypothetical protein
MANLENLESRRLLKIWLGDRPNNETASFANVSKLVNNRCFTSQSLLHRVLEQFMVQMDC